MTSTQTTIEHVGRANPVPLDPPAPPIEPLLARLDLSVRPLDQMMHANPARPARSRTVARVGSGLALATGAAVVVVAVTGSPGGGGVNVAAAVEQAITPGPGVLHIVTETETSTAGQPAKTDHDESWSTQSPRRMRSVITLTAEGETVEGEGVVLSTDPPRTLSWSRSTPDVIRESTQPVDASVQSPVAWLQSAYRDGRLKVLGESRQNGRAVWTLSVATDPSQAPQTIDGQPVPGPTVTVDAKTFVPLENVIYSATGESGHAQLETTRVHYLNYEELPAGESSRALLNLAPHPGAKVVAEAAAG